MPSSQSYYQFLHGSDPLERLATRAAAKDESLSKKKPVQGWITQQNASQTGCLVFWSNEGTRRCASSGLLGWQCYAAPGDIRVREVQLVGDAYFSDRHQLICAPQDVREVEVMSFGKFLERIGLPLVHRTLVYVTREIGDAEDVLVYSSNPEAGDVRVPGAEFQASEHPCEATFRVLQEQAGLDSQVEFRKLATSYSFDFNTRTFQALHYFQTPVYTSLPDQWQHAKSPASLGGRKVAHTFSWMKVADARGKLPRLHAAKLHMLEAKT